MSLKNKNQVNTEIDDIFRVTAITPDGYYIPGGSRVQMFLSKHEKWVYTETSEIDGGSILFIIEFKNVLSGEKAAIRNFCKDTIMSKCVKI